VGQWKACPRSCDPGICPATKIEGALVCNDRRSSLFSAKGFPPGLANGHPAVVPESQFPPKEPK
jgi:hypothetical protein